MQDYMENSSEMEIYRYLASGASGLGLVNDGAMWPSATTMNYNYGHRKQNFMNQSLGSGCGNGSSSSFYPAVAMGLMNDEAAEAKATAAASRIHHKEAEKRRRERINSHLDRLRSLLPCTTKTDKATLLSKVVQRVLELKRQTSELRDQDNLMLPSENDEFAVYIHNSNNIAPNNPTLDDDDDDNDNDNDDNKIILKATLCCDDRPDLFSDLNGVLNSLNMKTIRAEMSSLGGRVLSVLIVSVEGNSQGASESAVFLRDALKGIVERSGSGSGSGSEERLKRRRRVSDTDCY